MTEKTLNQCNELGRDGDPNIDKPSGFCDPQDLGQPLGSQRDVLPDGFADRPRRIRLGSSANCDPMQQTGWGMEMKENPSRETINRYSQVLRGHDEAMRDLFNDISVTDDNGVVHKIPIVLKTPEKAVAFILQQNVRKDSTFVVDRLVLPLLSLYQSDIAPDPRRYFYHKGVNYLRSRSPDGKPGWTMAEKGIERSTIFGKAWGIPVNLTYQLMAWTLYKEDMNQMIEQIHLKFSPCAYIRVQGVNVEIIVKHDSTANNQEAEPGDKNIRVIKYQFNFTVETYIPQPIVRKKAVLGIDADFVQMNEDKEIVGVLKKMHLEAE